MLKIVSEKVWRASMLFLQRCPMETARRDYTLQMQARRDGRRLLRLCDDRSLSDEICCGPDMQIAEVFFVHSAPSIASEMNEKELKHSLQYHAGIDGRVIRYLHDIQGTQFPRGPELSLGIKAR